MIIAASASITRIAAGYLDSEKYRVLDAQWDPGIKGPVAGIVAAAPASETIVAIPVFSVPRAAETFPELALDSAARGQLLRTTASWVNLHPQVPVTRWDIGVIAFTDGTGDGRRFLRFWPQISLDHANPTR